MLPHKLYQEDLFIEKCKQLRSRFDDTQEDSLFPKVEVGKSIPLDGLSIYIENTWDKIRNQKELNLPDQRVMVANLRCNELKDEALEKVKDSLKKMRDDSEKKIIEDFNTIC